MTEEEWTERDNAFDKELRELRNKYPEFYIEVWGPWDFVVGKARDHMPSYNEIIRQVIKHKDKWPDVVNELHEGFDANFGTNWDRIWSTLHELEHTQKTLHELRGAWNTLQEEKINGSK